eukprot:364478-Chlamydomonas_euryale.AAC.9
MEASVSNEMCVYGGGPACNNCPNEVRSASPESGACGVLHFGCNWRALLLDVFVGDVWTSDAS